MAFSRTCLLVLLFATPLMAFGFSLIQNRGCLTWAAASITFFQRRGEQEMRPSGDKGNPQPKSEPSGVTLRKFLGEPSTEEFTRRRFLGEPSTEELIRGKFLGEPFTLRENYTHRPPPENSSSGENFTSQDSLSGGRGKRTSNIAPRKNSPKKCNAKNGLPVAFYGFYLGFGFTCSLLSVSYPDASARKLSQFLLNHDYRMILKASVHVLAARVAHCSNNWGLLALNTIIFHPICVILLFVCREDAFYAGMRLLMLLNVVLSIEFLIAKQLVQCLIFLFLVGLTKSLKESGRFGLYYTEEEMARIDIP